jgi:hypothetical protein
MQASTKLGEGQAPAVVGLGGVGVSAVRGRSAVDVPVRDPLPHIAVEVTRPVPVPLEGAAKQQRRNAHSSCQAGRGYLLTHHRPNTSLGLVPFWSSEFKCP